MSWKILKIIWRISRDLWGSIDPWDQFHITFCTQHQYFAPYSELLCNKKASQKLSVGCKRLALGAKHFMKLTPGNTGLCSIFKVHSFCSWFIATFFPIWVYSWKCWCVKWKLFFFKINFFLRVMSKIEFW